MRVRIGMEWLQLRKQHRRMRVVAMSEWRNMH
jgi:hypothetical protein